MRIHASSAASVAPYSNPQTASSNSQALAPTSGSQKPTQLNWARNQLSTADTLLYPESVASLQNIVANAVTQNKTPVVVRGSMHSWSPVAIQDSGTAINLSKMVQAPKIDPKSGIARVSGGMQLGQLFEHLAQKGLTLAYKPTINDATVAGALATGTHGASREKGLLADQVVFFKLIDSKGRKVLVDKKGCHLMGPNDKIESTLISGPMPLEEMKLHRGVLGIVYEVGMQCVPAYDLELTQSPMYEDDAFGVNYSRLIEHMDNNEHADFFWFVPDQRVIMRHSNTTTKPRKPRNRLAAVLVDDFARSKMATLAMQFIRAFPAIARPVGWVAARTFIKTVVMRDRSDIIETYLPGHAESASQFVAMEYGVPYKRLREAIDIIRESVEGYEMPLPMYFRRVGDKLYFEFIWLREFPGGKEYAKKLEANLIRAFGADAQPHEGKIYFQNPWTRVPAEKQKDFLKLKQAVDPTNAFLNKYMSEYFSGKEDLSAAITNR